MSREVYIGFSTTDMVEPPYRVVDIELVKQDIRNMLNTRRGERVMRPEYGTRIFDLLMDPFDEETREAIIEDVIRVDLELQFRPQDSVDQLFLEYDRRNLQAF